MINNTDRLDALKAQIKMRLSEKRYLHTLGVLETALYLTNFLLPNKKYEISCAAILHDVAKELSYGDSLSVLREENIKVDEEFLNSPATIHSLTGTVVIMRDFPEYATENVLSAVKNHTVGSPDMSLFDEIIFLSDFIEPTRKYESCSAVRRFVYENLLGKSKEDDVRLIHRASVMAIDSTLNNLILNKRIISPKTVLTRNTLLDKINNII